MQYCACSACFGFGQYASELTSFVFIFLNIQVEVLWVVMPCSVRHHPEDEDSMDLRNVDVLPQ